MIVFIHFYFIEKNKKIKKLYFAIFSLILPIGLIGFWFLNISMYLTKIRISIQI
jgi:hypothetical protein